MKEVKNYKIKCEILSPVHIGDGTELEPLEYIIKENKLFKINLNEFLYNLPTNLQQDLKQLQQRNDLTGIRNFIKNNINLKKFSQWQTDVTEAVQKNYIEKFNELQNQLKVSPFIKSNDKPYIAGSSIKGTIRTALLNYWSDKIQGEPKAQNVEAEILDALFLNPKTNKYQFNMDRDPFRAVKVRDVFLLENSTIFSKVSNFNIDRNDKLNETKIQIIAEVIKSLSTLELEIALDEKLFNNPATKLQSRKIDLNLLLSACNTFYSKVLESEKTRLFATRDKNITEIYDQIKEKAKNGYLLRLGWGSGFESMTLEKFRNPKIPKKAKIGEGWGYSKNLVEGQYPLGWVKLVYP